MDELPDFEDVWAKLLPPASAVSMMAPKRDFKSVFESDNITLLVGIEQRRFTAHRDVISKVDFFANCLRHNTQEQQTSEIKLPEEEPEVIEQLLKYLYFDDFQFEEYPMEDPEWCKREYWVLIAKTYIAADKYCIEQLQNMVVSKARSICGNDVVHACTITMLNEAGLRECQFRQYLLRQLAYEIAKKGLKRYLRRKGVDKLLGAASVDAEDLLKSCSEFFRRKADLENPATVGSDCKWHVHTCTDTEKCDLI